eukprot:5232926-Prymnesium_polylepis.1
MLSPLRSRCPLIGPAALATRHRLALLDPGALLALRAPPSRAPPRVARAPWHSAAPPRQARPV